MSNELPKFRMPRAGKWRRPAAAAALSRTRRGTKNNPDDNHHRLARCNLLCFLCAHYKQGELAIAIAGCCGMM
jgi:hypothetical protein